jgi:antitoxin (DNA-binding transcriptional repressor) of toxin-antitoxin stability system
MSIVTIEEIQRHFAEYADRVEAGETIIITHHNLPALELKLIISPKEKLRPFGLCAGEFQTPDDFDAPLPEDILKNFDGIR